MKDIEANDPVVKLVNTAVFKTEACRGIAGSTPAGVTNTLEVNMANSNRGEKMKRLEALRAQYKARIEAKQKELAALESELAGFEAAFKALNGQQNAPASAMQEVANRAARPNVKQTVLSLLEQVGPAGLNAAKAVELAAARNEAIHQASVSSLLSRFKADGAVVYDGTNYKLQKFATVSTEAAAVH